MVTCPLVVICMVILLLVSVIPRDRAPQMATSQHLRPQARYEYRNMRSPRRGDCRLSPEGTAMAMQKSKRLEPPHPGEILKELLPNVYGHAPEWRHTTISGSTAPQAPGRLPIGRRLPICPTG